MVGSPKWSGSSISVSSWEVVGEQRETTVLDRIHELAKVMDSIETHVKGGNAALRGDQPQDGKGVDLYAIIPALEHLLKQAVSIREDAYRLRNSLS